LSGAATLCGANSGLTRDSKRRALASDHGVAGRRHTARSHSRTRPRWREARTGQRVSAATTPCGAVPGLASNSGRRAPTRRPRAHSPATGKPAAKLRAPHHCRAPAKRERRRKRARCPTTSTPRGRTACPALLQIHRRSISSGHQSRHWPPSLTPAPATDAASLRRPPPRGIAHHRRGRRPQPRGRRIRPLGSRFQCPKSASWTPLRSPSQAPDPATQAPHPATQALKKTPTGAVVAVTPWRKGRNGG
jgi:hypothetical protein